MRNSARLKIMPWVTATVVIAVASCAHAQRTAQRSVQERATSPDQLLARGDYYLRNNDLSDQADRYYKQLVDSFPTHRQAGSAQFNRGSYWHKKYNLLREKRQGATRPALQALDNAEGQYYDFIHKFAFPTNSASLLADAEFNLAIVYLQKNRTRDAIGWLNKLAYHDASRDPKTYVYRVVATSNAADVVDRTVDSAALAKYTVSIINKGLSVDQIISQVTQWVRKQ